MKVDDPEVVDVIGRCMVARIATLSRNWRPSINPLYFIPKGGQIWLGTDDWTLAARNVKANSHVSALFEVERESGFRRILRIKGRAIVNTDREVIHSYNMRIARKYILTLAGIRNALAHLSQIPLKFAYNAQGAEKGHPCVIEVIPEQIEFL
jgi:general stress protein 26